MLRTASSNPNRHLSWLMGLAALLLLVAPVQAGVVVNLDFTTGYATGGCDVATVGDGDCARGTSFSIGNPSVVITARTDLGNIATPQTPSVNPFTGGKTGVVYWGDLGNIGPTCITNVLSPGAVCPGLGVVTGTKTNKDGSVEVKGSTGISGGGGDQDEILIFNWSSAAQVSPSSIILTLQGFSATDDDTWIYLEFDTNSNPTGPDYAFKWENITTGSNLDFSTIAGLPTGVYVTQLGVLENTGHSGVAGITYEAVPEPAAFILTGIPLIALGLWRRRARKL